MCGIGRVVRRKGRIDARDRAALARTLREEAHRGPDDEGFYITALHETLAVWRDALKPPSTMDAIADDFNLYADGRCDDASLDIQRCEHV